MESILHRPASVGSLVKKIIAINPSLGVHEIVEIIRKSTSKTHDAKNDGFGSMEVVDEKKALELARLK